MTKTISNALFVGRLVICFIILFIIYLKYGPPKYVGVEAINEVLYLFIIPLFLIPGTIGLCLLVGLPLRLIPIINKWWLSNSYIGFIGLTIGFLIIIVNPNYTDTIKVVEDSTEIIKAIPNDTVLVIGWFITAFFLLHFYPIRFIESVAALLR